MLLDYNLKIKKGLRFDLSYVICCVIRRCRVTKGRSNSRYIAHSSFHHSFLFKQTKEASIIQNKRTFHWNIIIDKNLPIIALHTFLNK